MTHKPISFWTALMATFLGGISPIFAQGSPSIVWEVPTPSSLANSIVGVGWSTGSAGQVAVGSTDRWLRTRNAASGSLNYSILGPQHSRGGDQTIFSTDGTLLAVHNLNRGLDYRVYRAADGFFLGTITVTVDNNGLVRFASDAQLQGSVPTNAILSRWRIQDFAVISSVGSGYQVTTTSIHFSPNGAYQASATTGKITIQSRSNGAKISEITGGVARGSTPMQFATNSAAIAAWDSDSNRTRLWRVIDGVLLKQFPDAFAEEGVSAIRFSPDGASLVTSGYLAFQDASGYWQQAGVIRFWRVVDGQLLKQFDQRTGIAVTSAIAWSPNGTQFAYGTYEGTAVAARTPTFKSSAR